MKKRLLRKIRKQYDYSYQPKFNYMKYVRTIRTYIQKKHEININELELLLYMYDEDLFTKNQIINDFRGFFNIGSAAFKRMVSREFIMFWRNYGYGVGSTYTISPLGKRIVKEFYGKLHGDEIFSEKDLNNENFKASPMYSPAYLNMIKKMSEEIKESRIRKR